MQPHRGLLKSNKNYMVEKMFSKIKAGVIFNICINTLYVTNTHTQIKQNKHE